MRRVLVTAGQVYGRLDDNKLVGNRSRGIWAIRFADHLAMSSWREEIDHHVTLLVPDTMSKVWLKGQLSRITTLDVEIVQHTGFEDYQAKCLDFAKTHDAAVMAAAVVNWIPWLPKPGKMPTEGYKEGDVIDVPFYLAPRVINRMREVNPELTLIGCKMLVGAERWQLQGAAHKVALDARAHVVVANDLTDLHTKILVFPDRTVQEYTDDWNGFYAALQAVIDDDYWRTEGTPGTNEEIVNTNPSPQVKDAKRIFDAILQRYRGRFTQRDAAGKTVHGSLLVPVAGGGFLASPRIKNPDFTSRDAVWVAPMHAQKEPRTVVAGRGAKATMNVGLLMRMALWSQRERQEDSCFAVRPLPVLHLHEQLDGVPTVPYAPPGTDRDNLREIPGSAFNIEGHGFVACINPASYEIGGE